MNEDSDDENYASVPENMMPDGDLPYSPNLDSNDEPDDETQIQVPDEDYEDVTRIPGVASMSTSKRSHYESSQIPSQEIPGPSKPKKVRLDPGPTTPVPPFWPELVPGLLYAGCVEV